MLKTIYCVDIPYADYVRTSCILQSLFDWQGVVDIELDRVILSLRSR